MLFIYNDLTKEVVYFYSNNLSPLQAIFSKEPDKVGVYREIAFENDDLVIKSPQNYRLIFVDGVPITYAEKPAVRFSLSKNIIENDGVDSAILTVEISGTHPLDEITSIRVFLNSNAYKVPMVENVGQLEITAMDEGIVNIFTNNNQLKANHIQLEVI